MNLRWPTKRPEHILNLGDLIHPSSFVYHPYKAPKLNFFVSITAGEGTLMTKSMTFGLFGIAVLAIAAVGGFVFYSQKIQAKTTDQVNIEKLHDTGARLYTAACSSCHYNVVTSISSNRPTLALSDDVFGSDPSKLISAILYGRGAAMPGFASGLADSEVAAISAYLRATRSFGSPWDNLATTVATVRAKGNTRP